MVGVLLLVLIVSMIISLGMLFSSSYSKAFSVSFFLYNTIWCYFPIVASILRGSSIYPFIKYSTFLEFSLLELIPLTIIQIFIYANKRTSFIISETKLRMIDLGYVAEAVILFLSLTLTVYFWAIIGVKSNINYYDVNSIQLTQSGSFTARIIGSVLSLKGLLFGYLYVMILGSGNKTIKLYKIIAAIILILDAYINFIIGSRVALLIPVVLLIFYTIINRWSFKAYLPVAVVIAIFFFIGGALAIVAGDLRNTKKLTRETLVNDVKIVLNDPNTSNLFSRIADQALMKYDSISYGGFLVQSLGPGFAGFEPFTGSILSLIPRIVIPNKPVPGSADGTYYEVPQRLIPTILNYTSSDVLNVGVSPVAISIWETGYVGGILLFIFFNIPALLFLGSLFKSSSKLVQAIAFSTLNLPSMAYFMSSPDHIILTYQRLILFYLVVVIISLLTQYRMLRSLKRRKLDLTSN
jgi:hypothetical protein